MADEPRYTIIRLPDDQLALLMAEMRKGVAADPAPPARPPADLTGREAAMFREIVHDECEKLYARFKQDQERLFKRLRMPIDEDHINETSDALGDLFELNATIKSVTASWWKEIIGSILKWLGVAALAAGGYVGLTGGKH